MREEILKEFFLGRKNASELAADVCGSTKNFNQLVSRVEIEDMDELFAVNREMLIALCDAVLSGSLPAQELRTIGFALVASNRFEWDGDQDDLLASVIADWSGPEINYALTPENVGRFRKWLNGDEPYPDRPSSVSDYHGKIISTTEKKAIERHRRKRS